MMSVLELYVLFASFQLLRSNFAHPVSSLSVGTDPVPKYSRLILESSKTPKLEVEKSNKNDVWESKGFMVRNVSVLLNMHYTISPPPSFSASENALDPTVNSSQVFCSNITASLSISIKDFMYPVMFLNFSYYIEDTKEMKQEDNEKSPFPPEDSQFLQTKSSELKFENGKLPQSKNFPVSLKSTHIEPEAKGLATAGVSGPSASIHLKVPPKGTLETIPITHDEARKKRSLPEDPNTKPVNIPKQNLNAADAVIPITPAPIPENSSTPPLHSLTFVEAVEVIKNAAAVVAAGITSTGTTTAETGINGHTVISEITKANENNETLKGTVTESYSHKSKNTESIVDNDLNLKLASVVKTEKKNWKNNKNVKHQNEKQIEKSDNNEDQETEKLDGSSSSSSSSEEDLGDAVTVSSKKKISYKTWRASIEKKNRPPGLYVTVNDDIVFDNWDGIWDKPHILGKWTGSKVLPENKDKWNQTYIFMNWEDVTTRRDIKVIFEWEPIDKNSHVILSDIVVSTIAIPPNCDDESDGAPEKIVGSHDENIKPSSVAVDDSVMLGDQPKPDSNKFNDNTSFFLVKQNIEEGKGAWQIIKVEKKPDEYENVTSGDNTGNNSSSTKEFEFFTKVIKSLDVENSKKDATTETKQMLATNISSDTKNARLGEPPPTEQLTDKKSNLNKPSNSELFTTPTLMPNFGGGVNVFNTSTPSLSITKVDPNVIPSNGQSSPTLNPLTSAIELVKIPETGNLTAVTKDVQGAANAIQLKNISKETLHKESKLVDPSKHKTQKKTDGQTALIMSLFTGAIAVAVLAVILKRRIDISIKGRNATR